MMLPWLCFLVVAVAHGWALVRPLQSLNDGKMPRPADLAGISAVIYFDIGLLLDACGVADHSQFFERFYEAPVGIILLAIAYIAVAPWLLRVGANCVGHRSISAQRSRVGRGLKKYAFAAVVVLACTVSTLLPLLLVSSGSQVWENRMLLGQWLGPWIIVLSLPLYLLAFYAQLDSVGWRGALVKAALLISACLAAIAVGERTTLLMPFLVLLLTSKKVSLKRWATYAVAAAVAAALVLPLFKFNYRSGDAEPAQLVVDTVRNDFYRAPELARSLELSSVFGTRTLQYAGSGYVYSALFFAPRTVFPFKGDATAHQFTAAVMQASPESLDWGFGISALSEAVLNVGIVLAPLALVAYGALIAWLEGCAKQRPAIHLPICLASVWLFGYHLPALLFNFGGMALVGLACQKLFTEKLGNPIAAAYDGGSQA